ncbi:hypothetical protein H4219_000777 [Mycoemilia scoparia]|uniref:Ketoreductase domain-containing protein n=1 Tax=Mycoemilia scoparia TaxID=417184 RepID=A0A9W8DSL3_9FUNG|nr:hypothetical protein H4219_000777 [Mycoemilia scoparia]
MSATNNFRFNDRVVIITGAGGGLGKAYSLHFASLGAKVVVNDIGAVARKDGTKVNAADLVVEEIRKSGGVAVANHSSVEDGKAIVDTAMKNFGRIDVIINNAGILRDHSFKGLTDAEWDSVLATHLHGSYHVTKAAWEIMRKQKFGRIIMTSSAAGIYGNFGQANYSAAKHSLIGFSNSLAREGAKYNITCNAIAPLAASPMTATVMPQEILDLLKPEYIAPLVSFLTHESSTISGGLFEIGGGFVTAHRWEATAGVTFKADSTFTPAAIQARWNEICDFSGKVTYPTSIADEDWVQKLEEAKSLSKNAQGPELRFDGKVVIVSGAGGGLGRAYAHLFARHGANVVVNDLGIIKTKSGAQLKAADVVVDEIRKAGGKAVANYDSVEDGEKVVETALKNFGRLDVVVNNAGILRDRSFLRMTDADWDMVYRVHLRGTYKLSKAAWPIFLKQKGGAIINTSSAVGIHGNFGQTNYSSAKAGIQGLTSTLAQEGAKYNIRVNAIAPNAGTNMTATIMPPEVVEMLKPDYVAPLVGYLAHDECKDSGKLFQVGSCWVSEIRRQRTTGHTFLVSDGIKPEDIASKWRKITDFEDGQAHHVGSARESTMEMLSSIQQAAASRKKKSKSKSSNNKDSDDGAVVDVMAARNAKWDPSDFAYTERDSILYALGIGASRSDLKYVYESNQEFQAFPTYAVIAAFTVDLPFSQFIPEFNPMMLLHGEQYLEIHKPLPVCGKLAAIPSIVDIQDKGKGAAVINQVRLTDESGETVALTQSTVFIRGIGGFSKKPGFKAVEPAQRPAEALALNPKPARQPDVSISQKTSSEQAALYRLSGDYNPLHIDPDMSKIAGFKAPILHGLCTLGHAARHVIQAAAGGDATKLKSMKVRFTAPVFPGETLETQMWRDEKSPNRVLFQTRVVERDVVAISNAAIELSAPVTVLSNKSRL